MIVNGGRAGRGGEGCSSSTCLSLHAIDHAPLGGRRIVPTGSIANGQWLFPDVPKVSEEVISCPVCIDSVFDLLAPSIEQLSDACPMLQKQVWRNLRLSRWSHRTAVSPRRTTGTLLLPCHTIGLPSQHGPGLPTHSNSDYIRTVLIFLVYFQESSSIVPSRIRTCFQSCIRTFVSDPELRPFVSWCFLPSRYFLRLMHSSI